MIKLFGVTDKIYTSNGDIVLETTKAKVHKEDNGDFYINVEAPISENKLTEARQEDGSTASGTNFTINNVDKIKSDELNQIVGNTTQSGTPTPSSPQPINVVSGRQEVDIVGKNKFDKSDITFYANNSSTFIPLTSDTNNTRERTTSFSVLKSGIKANTTYKVSGIPTGWQLLGVGTFTSYGGTNTSQSSTNISNGTFSITSSAVEYIYLLFRNDSSTSVATELFNNANIQIEEGTTETTFEEFKGQSYEINLGKNLLSVPFTQATANALRTNIPNFAPGTYTFSFEKEVITNSQVWARKIVNGTSTNITYKNNAKVLTFTLDEYATLQLEIYKSGILLSEVSNLQLEKGTKTTFAPYKTPIELCKIGTYQDRIYKDNGTWYLHKEIGKVVLNGSESWSGGSSATTSTSYTYLYSNAYDSLILGNYYNAFNNNFTNLGSDMAASTSVNTDTISIGYTGSYRIRLMILTSRLGTQSVAGFKTWLSTHNTIVYYVLATPTTTEITDSELISQLNAIELLEGLNNVSVSSGDLAGEITIHYNYLNVPEINIKYIEYLVPNNIIVANTPQGDQAFRITNVENTRSKIKIKAYHVFYDSKNYLIQDSYVVDKNCNDALDHLNSSTDNISPFTTISDITKINSYRCVRKSLYEAIQVLLERYGGHLDRDNWTIGIKANIGQDNGVTIRYGKNLKNIKATYNWDNVVTKLMPVGKNGLLLNALDPTASVYLESSIQYEIPYTKTVSFDQSNIVEDDYKDQETGEVDEQAYTQALLDDLTQQGQNYVQTNSVPVVNYTLSANVEKVSDIGDTIQVVDEKLGLNILTNIISYEYDCILDKYTQIEFGNFTPTLSELMGNINNKIQNAVEENNATLQITLGQELEEAQNKIWNALGNSYVIYEGDKILVVDSLPKETATNVIMINNGGIGFSNNGINGTFNSAWTIDNILNMEQINVINLTADLIKGGTLKLGSNLNQNGQIEVYDEANSLIAELNKNGLKMYGVDGSYILMNNTVGFSGYDRLGNQIYWVSKDEFHMKKSVVEEEITLCNKMRFIPITITDSNDNIVNDGIGLVSVAGGGN